MRIICYTFATVLLAITLIGIIMLAQPGEAAYRKPPFNGSIFGKRNGIDYDNLNVKALTAICEIAMDACQSWFPGVDNK